MKIMLDLSFEEVYLFSQYCKVCKEIKEKEIYRSFLELRSSYDILGASVEDEEKIQVANLYPPASLISIKKARTIIEELKKDLKILNNKKRRASEQIVQAQLWIQMLEIEKPPSI